MKKRVSIINLILAVLIAGTGLASANLLTNSGFEAGGGNPNVPDDWFVTNPWVVSRYAETSEGHGDWTLLLGDNENAWHWASQTVAVTPGFEYTASVQFKGLIQEPERGYVILQWKDAGGTELPGALTEFKRADVDYMDWLWVSRSVTAVAPAEAASVEMRVMSYMDGNSDSALFADNAELVAIPEPATLGLFGLLGGGMLWARKRFRA